MKTIQISSTHPLDAGVREHVLDLENGYTFLDLISKILYTDIDNDLHMLMKANNGFKRSIENKEPYDKTQLDNVVKNINTLLETCVSIHNRANFSMRNERAIDELEEEIKKSTKNYELGPYMFSTYVRFMSSVVAFSKEEITKVLLDNIKKSIPVYDSALLSGNLFCADHQRRYFFTSGQKLEERKHDLFFLYCMNVSLAAPIRSLTNMHSLV